MATKDKAQYSRKWRIQRRQNRRFEIFGMEYLLVKYPAIHTEIGLFYDKLNNKYPRKNNLTKTYEFKAWKTDQEMTTTTPTDGQGQGTSTTITTTTSALGQGQGTSTTTTTTTSAVGQGQGTSTTITTTTSAVGQGQGTSTTTTAVIAEGQATGHDLDIEGSSSLYDLGVEDPPMCDLDIDSMDNIITDIIAEINQDPELRSIMDNFSY